MTRSKQRVTKMILQSVFVQTLKTEYMNICKYLHLINCAFASFCSWPILSNLTQIWRLYALGRCLFNSVLYLDFFALTSCMYLLIRRTERQVRTRTFWEKLRTSSERKNNAGTFLYKVSEARPITKSHVIHLKMQRWKVRWLWVQ